MKCLEGWNDIDLNEEGRCCCNCKHQVKIYKHPWNEGEAKGSIKEILGYGCHDPFLEYPHNNIIFMDRQHGMCETHEFKED